MYVRQGLAMRRESRSRDRSGGVDQGLAVSGALGRGIILKLWLYVAPQKRVESVDRGAADAARCCLAVPRASS